MNSALNDRSPRAIRGFGCRFRMGGVRCRLFAPWSAYHGTHAEVEEAVMYETTETS